jgi:hypothetical protein
VAGIWNLKPRQIKRGEPPFFESQGMVMCAMTVKADGKENIEFIDPPAGSKAGDVITIEGMGRPAPDASINPSKKNNAWKTTFPLLRTNKDRMACCDGKPLVTSTGPLSVPTLSDAQIS